MERQEIDGEDGCYYYSYAGGFVTSFSGYGFCRVILAVQTVGQAIVVGQQGGKGQQEVDDREGYVIGQVVGGQGGRVQVVVDGAVALDVCGSKEGCG